MLEAIYIPHESATTYETATDLCEVFDREMNSLYLLAFLLTTDSDKAEQCFVWALSECLEGPRPVMDWAPAWARRTILKQAIRMMMPAPDHTDQQLFSRYGTSADESYISMGSIVGLRTFERFVFVMSILERHHDEDCAALLRCSRPEVTIARERALRCLTATGVGYRGSANSSQWES